MSHFGSIWVLENEELEKEEDYEYDHYNSRANLKSMGKRLF